MGHWELDEDCALGLGDPMIMSLMKNGIQERKIRKREYCGVLVDKCLKS
jgi:hypothetical protein